MSTGAHAIAGGPFRYASGRHAEEGRDQHRGWLDLIEVTGPFLALPVLLRAWPQLDSLDALMRDRLRREHADWQADPHAGQRAWIDFVLRDLLEWGDALHHGAAELAGLALDVAEHDATVLPSFALVEPSSARSATDSAVEPARCRLLGLVCEPGAQPMARIPGSEWAATPVDRLAHLLRHHGIELGLATDGRWWALVWAPRGGVTTTAAFDAVSWNERAERSVVRAFVSLLRRSRFFAVPDDETLTALLGQSLASQEEVTVALGTQVRLAVELLMAAIGRADRQARERGDPDLADVPAPEIYRSAVAVMTRIVFLLIAEERGLLPCDNPIYAAGYSAGRLCEELEQRARDTSEEDLEHSTAAWHRLLALFRTVYGIKHPKLGLPAYDGSLFDPSTYPWLEGQRTGQEPPGSSARPLPVDDRTVLHMLRAVQYVEIGSGRTRERRRLSFRAVEVEQIGYVYEGLLSYDGFRAVETMVGLVGRAGQEAEVPLAELERLAVSGVRAGRAGITDLAGKLAETYKKSGIGSRAAVERRLALLTKGAREEALRKLLAVTGGERSLAERLLPWYGIVRRDLRGLPVVIQAGSLYVTESPLRKHTGTTYTPRFLAEQVVEGALEALVYTPGPLQTADRDAWKLKSSDEILALNVADIAAGSGAFLVAACRYLAARLVEAWSAEDDPRAREYLEGNWNPKLAADADADPVIVHARRQVIEHCLYGVDINPMAVEIAKLSLWLISLDPTRPFTFLDDRLVSGDSLLGITSLEQLEWMHLDPRWGRRLHEQTLDFTANVRNVMRDIAEMRRRLVAIDGKTLDALRDKRSLLTEIREKTKQETLFADLSAGAALASAGRREREQDSAFVTAAILASNTYSGGAEDELAAGERAQRWLATNLPDGWLDRSPLHWPLVFPEVFEKGGFDAIVGNKPYLGGKKLTGVLGDAYREYLVEWIGHGVRGSADLIAYFVLRAHELINSTGQTGLIATNTLAQGDTREVSLQQLVDSGVTIRQAVKSEPWPSRSSVLEYCVVWTSRASLGESAHRRLDGIPVADISSSLDPLSRTGGLQPQRLAANSDVAFIGSYVLGMGFTLGPDEAEALIAKDERNREVVFPYLNGQDVNSSTECTASRWVINFFDWSVERARTYAAALSKIERDVRPERQRRKPNGTFMLRNPLPQRYWHYADKRPALYRTIAGLERVIVITRVSKVVMPVMVPTGQVFSEATVVFASDDAAMLALLSSAPHYCWAIERASTLETRIRYTPTDVFEPLPRPELTEEMRELGDRLDTYRRGVMLSRKVA